MSKITLRFLVVIFITSVFISNAFANIPKGQKAYIKNCKVCHGNGTKGASMHTQEEWEELFANNGDKIKQAHQKDEIADAFFKTELFLTHYKNIRDFLLYGASDSDR
jgi:hypothetical protein